MFYAYITFCLIWALVVAATQPPLIVGALLVALPIVVIGYILRGELPGASQK